MCRKGKRNSANTRLFEVNLYSEIKTLSETLISGTYTPSRSVCFFVTKPKLREVFAADFRDRVVHRLLFDILEPEFERSFIFDSYSNRTGKGTHAAVERLKGFLKKGTRNGKVPFYCLQLDIKGFFMEIHKDILFQIVCKKVKKPNLQVLCKTIIYHDPTQNFVYKGRIPPRETLPPHKTLFHKDKKRGIPIGNLTSQFFANIYLNEMDQFIKRGLSIKFYIRYVDDFLLLSDSKESLLDWKRQIIRFLETRLRLCLKDEFVEPFSVYDGIDFLGYFVKPGYTLVRKRVVRNMKIALKTCLPAKNQPKRKSRKSSEWECLTSPNRIEKWKKFQARLNSYLAHLNKANSYHLKEHLQKVLEPYFPFLEFKKGYIRLKPRRPDRFSYFRVQVNFFRKQFPKMVLIIQVGRLFELYGYQVETIANELKLKKYKRGNFHTWGFRIFKLNKVILVAKQFYLEGVLILQMDKPSEKVRIRLPIYSWKIVQGTQLRFHF